MLMDVSSEMIHALLPVYLVTVLGTSMVTVGVIEGIAGRRHRSPKYSPAFSDWLENSENGCRSVWPRPGGVHQARVSARATMVGYGRSSLSWIEHPRRARDALVADIAPPHRGAALACASRWIRSARLSAPLLAIGLM